MWRRGMAAKEKGPRSLVDSQHCNARTSNIYAQAVKAHALSHDAG